MGARTDYQQGLYRVHCNDHPFFTPAPTKVMNEVTDLIAKHNAEEHP